jgi:hypothetical protein
LGEHVVGRHNVDVPDWIASISFIRRFTHTTPPSDSVDELRFVDGKRKGSAATFHPNEHFDELLATKTATGFSSCSGGCRRSRRAEKNNA